MTDRARKAKDPPPIVVRELNTASRIPYAFTLLTNAVLHGHVRPEHENSAAYRIASASRARAPSFERGMREPARRNELAGEGTAPLRRRGDRRHARRQPRPRGLDA